MSAQAINSNALMMLSGTADEHVEQLLVQVIAVSHERSKTDEVARALLCFLVRVVNSRRSIRTLRDHSPRDEMFLVDAGTLLRAMYDAYLQAEYMVADVREAPNRARDYFDFEHVELYKWRQKVLNHDNLLTDGVKLSPDFAEAEKAQEDAYNRVKDRFPIGRKPNGKTREHWYPGQLKDIAGNTDEYDICLWALQGCVHSSALAMREGPPVPDQLQYLGNAACSSRRSVECGS